MPTWHEHMRRLWEGIRGRGQSRPLILEDFRSGNPPLSRRALPFHQNHLWSQYPNDPTHGPDPGQVAVRSRGDGHVLRVAVESGNCYLQRTPQDPVLGIAHNLGHKVPGYVPDTYTRLRFWFRTNARLWQPPAGSFNLHVGTYLRTSTEKVKQETPITPIRGSRPFDGHAYHYYAIPNEYNREWRQVEVDMHPHHLRDANLPLEEWDMQLAYPTREPGYNYFDAMTRLYIDFLRPAIETPCWYEFRDFELLKGHREDNTRQVYGVHCVYSPSRKRLHLGWSCSRHENGDGAQVGHDVWWARHDIHASGLGRAIKLAENITASGTHAYNAMSWGGRFDPGNATVLYLAIRPRSSNTFRQVVVPLTNL